MKMRIGCAVLSYAWSVPRLGLRFHSPTSQIYDDMCNRRCAVVPSPRSPPPKINPKGVYPMDLNMP